MYDDDVAINSRYGKMGIHVWGEGKSKGVESKPRLVFGDFIKRWI